ncbi:MAG: hypothetical protein JO321_15880 [Solirubrobacterales bacterium]|nr:hypothetical protein [Solirubrobacterales bacterium]MBV9168012.1 hypothetical protein [Solirubrobacterales bacterium]MBV9536879.1 hypothetical protein [Solirubrobacterales bacterium]
MNDRYGRAALWPPGPYSRLSGTVVFLVFAAATAGQLALEVVAAGTAPPPGAREAFQHPHPAGAREGV